MIPAALTAGIGKLLRSEWRRSHRLRLHNDVPNRHFSYERKARLNNASFWSTAVVAFGTLMLAACASPPPYGTTSRNEDGDRAMIPSITYLHLLKDTPFFTALTRSQLQWVIDHSRDWTAPARTVVASYTAGQPASDDLWVLLDGGWQIEADGKQYPAGHADPGKWFSAADVAHDCRLVVTEKSYVMKIESAELKAMLAQGFAFGRHLEAGKNYYRTLFRATSTPSIRD
jgi:hypothetical protein